MFKRNSIAYQLISGGVLLVLIPLLAVGLMSVSKSANAFRLLSKNQIKVVAENLARITQMNLLTELSQARTLAAKNMVIRAAGYKYQGDSGEFAHILPHLRQNIKETFEQMDAHYEGLFLTDRQGNVFVSVRTGGEDYSGINISDREYFQNVIKSKRAVIGGMTRSKATDKVISVACAPIQSASGVVLGTLGMVIEADYFSRLISEWKIGESGYGCMLDSKGLVLSHPVNRHVLSLNFASENGFEGIFKKITSLETGVDEYFFNGIEKIGGYAPVGINNWFVFITQEMDELMQLACSIRDSTLVIGVAALVVSIFFLFYLSKAIVNPLNSVVAGLKDIAEGEGDLTMRLAVTRKNEIGELASWFNTFIKKLQDIIRQTGEHAALVDESSAAISKITGQMLLNVEKTAGRADTVAISGGEVNTNINNMAAAMEESSTNTNMVASAAEEISLTINDIARNSDNARTMSHDAVDKSREIASRMAALGSAASSIGRVTEVITDISEQTNLLALNATIEAARAGDAGKGFAVVAQEIKALAMQTSGATLDIKNQIQGIQDSTGIVVKDIDGIAMVIKTMNDIVSSIASAVEEQSSATTDIAGNISQLSLGIQEVNGNVAQSSSAADEIAREILQLNSELGEISHGIGQMNIRTEAMDKMSSQLNTIVGTFKV